MKSVLIAMLLLVSQVGFSSDESQFVYTEFGAQEGSDLEQDSSMLEEDLSLEQKPFDDPYQRIAGVYHDLRYNVRMSISTYGDIQSNMVVRFQNIEAPISFRPLRYDSFRNQYYTTGRYSYTVFTNNGITRCSFNADMVLVESGLRRLVGEVQYSQLIGVDNSGRCVAQGFQRARLNLE
jgi:hypothetical protein